MATLPRAVDPDLLVGAETADDAAVFRIGPDQAVVFTVDYFTPVVDDPYDFGRVVAANCLSDTWAMGAEPRLALNLVGFPAQTLPLAMLADILRGGSDVAGEAGVLIVGGHSIDDPEPKYGMAVLGFVQPDRIVTNVGARPGDRIVLTKPLGSGIIATGIKRQQVSDETVARLVGVMSALNRGASRAMQAVGVNAATDVTGFGLLGHLGEMLGAGDTGALVRLSDVPVLEETWDLARAGVCPVGSWRNLASAEKRTDFAADIEEFERLVLCDAQTSGGLLMAVAPEKTDALLAALRDEKTLAAAVVGEFTADAAGRISVVR